MSDGPALKNASEVSSAPSGMHFVVAKHTALMALIGRVAAMFVVTQRPFQGARQWTLRYYGTLLRGQARQILCGYCMITAEGKTIKVSQRDHYTTAHRPKCGGLSAIGDNIVGRLHGCIDGRSSRVGAPLLVIALGCTMAVCAF
jgi:hypothetical protein